MLTCIRPGDPSNGWDAVPGPEGPLIYQTGQVIGHLFIQIEEVPAVD
jgi:hypothetical protein